MAVQEHHSVQTDPLELTPNEQNVPTLHDEDRIAGCSLREKLTLLGFLFFFFGFLFDITRAVLLLETFDPAGGIYEFLLAGIERMAHRAYLGVDFLGRAAGLERIAAAAVNDHFLIFWMYVFLHNP
jgi:hypothetical protein